MTFYLVGLGLNFNEIPKRTLEIIEKIEEVYLEGYTSLYPEKDLKKLISMFPKIKIVDRKFVEEELEKFLDRERDIVLLVIGDPLFATTHFSLIEACIRKEIDFEIVHAPSVINHISKTGLFLYKFGKVASIPFFYSETPYNILKENKSIGAHTLFLLDLDLKEGKFLTPDIALKSLLEIEEKRKEKVLSGEDLVVVCERLGWEDEKIYYSNVSSIVKHEFSKPPYCIIIPSNLNPVETEFLKLVGTKLD